jgi:hypothetical protein
MLMYSSRETLVTLRVIVLKANLKFDGFEEVSLFGLERILKELLDVRTHSGWWHTVSSDSIWRCRRPQR